MKKARQLTNKEVKKEAIYLLKGQMTFADDDRSDLDIIVDDYIKCIKYLLNGKVVLVIGFRDGVQEWLVTDGTADVNIDSIPHDESELTECRYEIEALIADNSFDDDTILQALNDKIQSISAEY